MEKLKVGIIGSTGYVGAELIRILSNHDKVVISAIGSSSFIDKEINEVYPSMGKRLRLKCVDNNEVIDNSDFIFTALPHGISEKFAIEAIKKGKKVIDLGADFRLKDEEEFEKWYDTKFIDKELHEEAVYGLCEVNRERVKKYILPADMRFRTIIPHCQKMSFLQKQTSLCMKIKKYGMMQM